MARAADRRPGTAAQARSRGAPDEIRACIGCNDACIHQVVQVKGIRCIQNPGRGPGAAVRGAAASARRRSPRHVVVVGGGPAGLKAAEIAARRGHQVTLLERDGVLGGQVRLAARQPLHEEVAEVTAYLESTVARLGVEVWLERRRRRRRPARARAGRDRRGDRLPAGPAAGRRGSPRIRTPARSPAAVGLQVPNPLPGPGRGPIVRSVRRGPRRGRSRPAQRVLVIDAHGHWEAAGTAEYLADRGFDRRDRHEPARSPGSGSRRPTARCSSSGRGPRASG